MQRSAFFLLMFLCVAQYGWSEVKTIGLTSTATDEQSLPPPTGNQTVSNTLPGVTMVSASVPNSHGMATFEVSSEVTSSLSGSNIVSIDSAYVAMATFDATPPPGETPEFHRLDVSSSFTVQNSTDCNINFDFFSSSLASAPTDLQSHEHMLTAGVLTTPAGSGFHVPLSIQSTIPAGTSMNFSLFAEASDFPPIPPGGFAEKQLTYTLVLDLNGQTCTCSIPEPSGFLYLGVVLIGVFGYRRRQRLFLRL